MAFTQRTFVKRYDLIKDSGLSERMRFMDWLSVELLFKADEEVFLYSIIMVIQ
jgi:hypothetical protein